jgi:UDP-N-acetylmuramate dehydrogenase
MAPAETRVSRAFVAVLAATFGDKLRKNEPLSGHTTLRLGGPADVWLPVTSLTELVTAVNLARQHQTAVFVLGGGANLLISDAGIRGLVIENRANQVHFPSEAGAGSTGKLVVESGVVLPNLARRCAKRGLSGLEWAGGVPGTVGGAVVNNAGAYGSDMTTSLVRVELLTPAGDRVWQPLSWLRYGYRTSRLKERNGTGGTDWIVLQAELRMSLAPVSEIEARMHAFNERRKSNQPPGATIGSMFKNPKGDYAGRLIEAAGLKGYQVGRARISSIHANFFQNLGGATSSDVLALIEAAQAAVEKKFGVRLELEIEVVGEPG